MERKIIQLTALTIDTYRGDLFAIADDGSAWRLVIKPYGTNPDWERLPGLPPIAAVP